MAALTQANSSIIPNRPHDYIYDKTFTVSSHNDHVKQITRSQAQQVIINPNFGNMFSALRHYPPMQYHLKVNPFPHSIGHDRRVAAPPVNISGSLRYKYFSKAIMPHHQLFTGQIIYARQKEAILDAQLENRQKPLSHLIAPSKVTVATQSTYRISETQTDPYSPDYVFDPDNAPPELLALATLSYGSGLPATRAETEMIQRARLKREWEATLPPITTAASFEKRFQMMQEMEIKEWKEREIEIKRLQDERMSILEKVVRQREKENDHENDLKVERIWQQKMQARNMFFEKLNAKRIKALRKLKNARALVTLMPIKKRNIIGEYGDYASAVYAPTKRQGVFSDRNESTIKIDIPEISHYKGLEKIQDSIPELNSTHPANIPTRLAPLLTTPEQRRHQLFKNQLDSMHQTLVLQKQIMKTPLSKPAPPVYAIKLVKPTERPPTPSIIHDTEVELEMHISAHILQNLVRGRKLQVQIMRQTHRKKELLKELAAKNAIKPKEELKGGLDNKLTENVMAEYVALEVDFLTKQLVRLRQQNRIQKMVLEAEKLREARQQAETKLRISELSALSVSSKIFASLLQVYTETSVSFLESVITETIATTARKQAHHHAAAYYRARGKGMEMTDMVSCLVIPYVEKRLLKETVNASQEPFLLAAHQAVYASISKGSAATSTSTLPSPSPLPTTATATARVKNEGAAEIAALPALPSKTV